VQSFDDQELFFFIEVDPILYALVGEWGVEPFLEALDAFKNPGKNKIQQGP
jgi:hypothetical protein